MRRTLTWLVTLPLAAASVLLGHALAYRITGAPLGDVHGYLEHVPQVVFILASVAVLGLAADTRARRRSPLPLATVGVAAFVVQEHLERFAHTGHLPFLLASPVFWVGIALQLPLAVVVWLLARGIADELATPLERAVARLAHVPVAPAPSPAVVRSRVAAGGRRTRGPPPHS
jgi:hypothetical protein